MELLMKREVPALSSVSCLGPEGTYSSVAAATYLRGVGRRVPIAYFDRVEDAIAHQERSLSHTVLAIENSSEGFITRNIKFLAKLESTVVAQVPLPIDFAFVHNCERPEDVETVFVTTIALGQVSRFSEACAFSEVVVASSNANSLKLFEERRHELRCGAIIPGQLARHAKDARHVLHINDNDQNFTRFFILRHGTPVIEDVRDARCLVAIASAGLDPVKLMQEVSALERQGCRLASLFPIPRGVGLRSFLYFLEFDVAGDVERAVAAIDRASSIELRGGY